MSKYALFTNYYEGEARARSATSFGPIHVTLWQVLYTHDTQIYVLIENTGDSPVQLFEKLLFATPDASDDGSSSVPYFLRDDQGRRYRLTGDPGWTFTGGDSPQSYGQVAPGGTADFLLGFPPIPDDVPALMLVMEDLQSQDGRNYTLHVRCASTSTRIRLDS